MNRVTVLAKYIEHVRIEHRFSGNNLLVVVYHEALRHLRMLHLPPEDFFALSLCESAESALRCTALSRRALLTMWAAAQRSPNDRIVVIVLLLSRVCSTGTQFPHVATPQRKQRKFSVEEPLCTSHRVANVLIDFIHINLMSSKVIANELSGRGRRRRQCRASCGPRESGYGISLQSPSKNYDESLLITSKEEAVHRCSKRWDH